MFSNNHILIVKLSKHYFIISYRQNQDKFTKKERSQKYSSKLQTVQNNWTEITDREFANDKVTLKNVFFKKSKSSIAVFYLEDIGQYVNFKFMCGVK